LADPCKELFERASALAQQILDNIDQGYDQAKSDERDQVKKEYEDCLDNPPEEETYEGKKAKCQADFGAAVDAAQATRDAAESQAEAARDAAIKKAQDAHKSKMATLDAIAEACKVPPPVTGVSVGGITTEGTGTVIESGNPACTGKFTGYDPEIQAELNRLRTLYDQARLKDRQGGIGGAGTYAAKMNELRAEMTAGPRKCAADSDCGDTTKVCCSETEVGWVVCSGGECTNEKEECEDDEICAGKPAECVGGTEGAQSEPIEIARTYIIGTPCNSRIQVIQLRPKNENSVRFEITGNIPNWLGFSSVGGKFPQDVTVTVDCNTLETPGTYEATAMITVYDAEDNLINTIPVNITVTSVAGETEDEDAVSAGDDVDLVDPEEEAVSTGGDAVIEEEAVAITPSDVSFTYDHANPACPLAITPVVITGPEGATWSLSSDLPVWLNVSGASSGSVPGTVRLQFPCQLDRYEDQQQSATIQFEVNSTIETEIVSLDIAGNFTNF
jgi:hypothetical protein